MKKKINSKNFFQKGAVSLIFLILAVVFLLLINLSIASANVLLGRGVTISDTHSSHGYDGRVNIDGSAVAQMALGEVDKCYGSDAAQPYGPTAQWCAYFATWCYREAGYDMALIANSRAALNYFKKNHYAHKDPARARPGELVTWYRGSISGSKGHAGIVVENNQADKKIKVVEGNTSNDCVKLKTYTYDKIVNRMKGLYGFGGWLE
jgi:hypothetical protein